MKKELVQCENCEYWLQTETFTPFVNGGICRLLPQHEITSGKHGCHSGCSRVSSEPDAIPFPGVLVNHPDVKVA